MAFMLSLKTIAGAVVQLLTTGKGRTTSARPVSIIRIVLSLLNY